jgi:inorganic triphosphatase YgiF
MAASREIELKLEMDRDDLPALKEHGLLAGRACDEKRQTSIYFDTPDGRLRKAGMTLRVRESEGRYVQTVKSDGLAAGGLFDRGEWEKDVEGNAPDLDLVKQLPLGHRLGRKGLPASVEPQFETVVDRSEWHVAQGEDEVQLVLDQGEVATQAASAPIMEVELELMRGSATRLFDLARELNGSVPLRLGVLTKSERGYRLLDGAKRGVVKVEPIALTRDMTTGEGFQAIAFACLRHFRLNEPLFTGDREGAALHQARVAFRRLRSALSLFAPAIEDDALESIRCDLRWISGPLGAARDLDVFVQKRMDPTMISPDLWSQVVAQREAAFDEAIAALESKRFRALMISLAQWIATGKWREADGEASAWREQPLGDFASFALDRLWHKMRKRGRHLAGLDDDERHRARIAGKKLRYASEFFTSLFEGKKSRAGHAAFVKALENLQEQLGSLNDLVTAGSLSADIASHIKGESARKELLAASTGGTHAEKPALLAAGEDAYGALLKAGPFWR